MPNQIRDYFQLLGVGSSTADPTIPFDNEFHLLGLDESESDQQIAQKAKALANTRADVVDKRGQAQNKRLDVLLRDKINQTGLHFDGQPARVAEHREELHRMRERRLKDFAKDLCDSGKWTAKEGTDMVETIASRIGIAPDRLHKAVSDAVQSAGQWATGTATPRPPLPTPPQPPPVTRPVVVDSIAIGSKSIPLWAVIPPIGLALGLINAWAGLAFGLAFLILALGKANAERQMKVAATTRHLQWGAVNAAITSLPLLALLAFGPAAAGPEAKWAGEWDTNWGKMTFTVKSSRVTAQYESPTGSGKVDLKTTNEHQLDGSWCRGACAPPNDTGHLRLILDESGQAFKGWYTDGLDSEIKQSDDPAYQVNGRRKAQQ